MPISTNMAVRPSSDDKSDYDEFDSDDSEDFQDSEDSDEEDELEDEESEDESEEETNDSATFVTPLRSVRKVVPVSNGTTKLSSLSQGAAFSNEVIICDSETLNGASNSSCSNMSTGVSGSQSVGFDPLNVDEKDPLDIDESAQTGDSDVIEISDVDDDESEEDLLSKVSLPIIKINRISGAETAGGWKIKSKPEGPAKTPDKLARPTRQVTSFSKLEVDELPARKARLRQTVSTANPSPSKQPTPSTRRGRRKRTDSEDSFEIMPFKRRQFKSVEGVDDKEVSKDNTLRTSTPTPTESVVRRGKLKSSAEITPFKRQQSKSVEGGQDEESRDSTDIHRTSTPTPNGRRGTLKSSTDVSKTTVAAAQRISSRLRGTVEQQSSVQPKTEIKLELPKPSISKEQPLERLSKPSNSEDTSVDKLVDVSMDSTGRKRGRPKKIDQV